jgi:TPR repeat protein
MLGLALMTGMGVPIDLVEAHRWTAAAVRAGNPPAQQQLATLELRMDAAALEKARSLGPQGPAPASRAAPTTTTP